MWGGRTLGLEDDGKAYGQGGTKTDCVCSEKGVRGASRDSAMNYYMNLDSEGDGSFL